MDKTHIAKKLARLLNIVSAADKICQGLAALGHAVPADAVVPIDDIRALIEEDLDDEFARLEKENAELRKAVVEAYDALEGWAHDLEDKARYMRGDIPDEIRELNRKFDVG